MNLTIELYALLRDRAGTDRIEIPVAGDSETAGALLSRIAGVYPALAPYLNQAAVAQSNTYVARDEVLLSHETVCLFPPVSGGSADYRYLSEAPLPIDRLMASLSDSAAGAQSIFVGTVRQEGCPPLAALDYEAHLPMAEAECQRIVEEAGRMWPLRRVVLVNRLGRVPVGAPGIVIGVSAAHRREAFEACRYIIENVKSRVPIWKREVFQDGTIQWAAPCSHEAVPTAPPEVTLR